MVAIRGVPGAAHFDGAVSLPTDVRQALIPPRNRYLLLAADNGLSVVPWREFAAGEPPAHGTHVPGTGGCLDAAWFSASGDAVLTLCRASGTVQLLTGLPSTPKLTAQLSDTLLPAAALRALAASDDGTWMVAVDTTGAAYRLFTDRAPERLGNYTDVSAITFVPRSHRLIVCDRAREQVWILNPDGGVLASGAESLPAISSVVAMTDQSAALLLGEGDGRVWRMALPGGEVTEIALPEPANVLVPLFDSNIVLFSLRAGRPAWIYNGRADAAPFAMIPAADAALVSAETLRIPGNSR